MKAIAKYKATKEEDKEASVILEERNREPPKRNVPKLIWLLLALSLALLISVTAVAIVRVTENQEHQAKVQDLQTKLMTIHSHFKDACCYKVRVTYILKTEAYDNQKKKYGVYTMEHGLTNAKPSWTQEDGSNAIWLNEGDWIVGPASSHGKGFGGLQARNGANCVHDVPLNPRLFLDVCARQCNGGEWQ